MPDAISLGRFSLDQGGGHTVIDLRGAIPVFLAITTGKVSDVNLLDAIPLPARAIVAVDRGYLLYALHHSATSRSSFAPKTTYGKTSIDQMFANANLNLDKPHTSNQMNLCDF